MSLSGGQMQRLAVVVSDICGKELLVFDEPTSGLDLKSMEEVGILTRSLATQGKVLLIITHDIEFMMRICTRILFIRDGEIVKDLSGGQKEKIVRLCEVRNDGGKRKLGDDDSDGFCEAVQRKLIGSVVLAVLGHFAA